MASLVMPAARNVGPASGASAADDGLEPSETPVAIGEVVAEKYVVESVLGSGGMGVVVAARHRVLQSRFAVKLLHVTRSDDKFVRRLLREAEIVAQLRSPHVVRVFDAGVMSSGAPYIVMELLEGEDLATRIDREGRIPVPEAVGYLLEACEAIAEAHGQGVIHRDLKPANLFLATGLDQRPTVKVLDFGISKRTGAQAGRAITQANDLLGSPGYMAPEQIRGAAAADMRSDIWALGVILYELLSGVAAFDGEVLHEIFARVSIGKVEPLPESVPEGIRAIVAKCLQRDPDERFASVSALAAALVPFAAARQLGPVERAHRIQPTNEPSPSEVPAVARPVVERHARSTTTSARSMFRPAVLLAVAGTAFVVSAAMTLVARARGPSVTSVASATSVATSAPRAVPPAPASVVPPAPVPVATATAEPVEASSAAPAPRPSARPIRAAAAPTVTVSASPPARPASGRKVDPEEFLRQR